MKNTTIGTIGRFLEEYKEIHHEIKPKRGMYLNHGTGEMFVIEYDSYRVKKTVTVVFYYDSAELHDISTEIGTMEKYFLLIPTADHAEYLNLQ